MKIAKLLLEYIIPICLILVIISYAFHVLTPVSWHYLTPKQVSTIGGIALGVVIGNAFFICVEWMRKYAP